MNQHVFNIIIFFTLSLGAFSDVHAAKEPQLKEVSLLQFMQGDLYQPLPISLAVPDTYDGQEFDEEPGTYYWMRSKDAKKARKTQNLPSKKGYMYGKITQNVGYDKTNDLFIGLEEPEVQEQMKKYFGHFESERITVQGHPVVLVRLTQTESEKTSYMIYVAMNIDTNVVLISYIPPKRSHKNGEPIWKQMVDHLKQQNQRGQSH